MADISLEEVKLFVKNQQVLIIDPSNSTRKTLKMAMTQLGIHIGNIRSTGLLHEAIQLVMEFQPKIIFTEFKIRDRYGMELIPQLDQLNIGALERCFFIVTENSRQSAVAEAAEGDVDGYIIKPFTIETLNSYVLSTIKEKMRPSQYFLQINQAKQMMENGKVEEAIELLNRSIGMNPSPTLALFYLGQAYRLIDQKENALKSYRSGLRYQKNHYKCAVGEFEVLDELGQNNEAYLAAKKLFSDYPMSAQKLGRVITLAVYTRHLEDLPGYYETFLKLDHRPDDLVKIVSAGMFVCGKSHLISKNPTAALTFFKRASALAPNRVDMISKCIESLMQENRSNEALELFNMLSPQEKIQNQWKAAEFKIWAGLGGQNQVLDMGRRLIKEKVAHPFIYITVAKIYIAQGKLRQAEFAVYEGVKLCPDHKAEMLALIEEAQKLEEIKKVD